MKTDELNTRLIAALDSGNPELVEDVLSDVWEIDNPNALMPTLCKLLEANWHFQHENIVRWMQEIADPKSIPTLLKTAYQSFEYLNYDEAFGLARKCTWALADIGSPEAKDALILLGSHKEPLIAGYAQRRLDRWESELNRKKHPA